METFCLDPAPRKDSLPSWQGGVSSSDSLRPPAPSRTAAAAWRPCACHTPAGAGAPSLMEWASEGFKQDPPQAPLALGLPAGLAKAFPRHPPQWNFSSAPCLFFPFPFMYADPWEIWFQGTQFYRLVTNLEIMKWYIELSLSQEMVGFIPISILIMVISRLLGLKNVLVLL